MGGRTRTVTSLSRPAKQSRFALAFIPLAKGPLLDDVDDFHRLLQWVGGRIRPLNLGWCFLPSKVVSDTSFLGRLWKDLAKILGDY